MKQYISHNDEQILLLNELIKSLAFPRLCRGEADPHIVQYKLYISLVLLSVMASTADTGEQFRLKLPEVDSFGM